MGRPHRAGAPEERVRGGSVGRELKRKVWCSPRVGEENPRFVSAAVRFHTGMLSVRKWGRHGEAGKEN